MPVAQVWPHASLVARPNPWPGQSPRNRPAPSVRISAGGRRLAQGAAGRGALDCRFNTLVHVHGSTTTRNHPSFLRTAVRARVTPVRRVSSLGLSARPEHLSPRGGPAGQAPGVPARQAVQVRLGGGQDPHLQHPERPRPPWRAGTQRPGDPPVWLCCDNQANRPPTPPGAERWRAVQSTRVHSDPGRINTGRSLPYAEPDPRDP